MAAAMMRLVVLKKGLVSGYYRTRHGRRTFVSPYSDRRGPAHHTGPLDPKQGSLFGGPVADAAQRQAQALIDAHGGDVGEAKRHHKENAQVAHHLGEQKPEDVATHVATAAALKEKGEGDSSKPFGHIDSMSPAEYALHGKRVKVAGHDESDPFSGKIVGVHNHGSLFTVRDRAGNESRHEGQHVTENDLTEEQEEAGHAKAAADAKMKADAEDKAAAAKLGDPLATARDHFLNLGDRDHKAAIQNLSAARDEHRKAGEHHQAKHYEDAMNKLPEAMEGYRTREQQEREDNPPPSNVISLADARARRDAMASAQSAEAEKMGAKKAAHTAEHMKHLRAGDRIVMDGRARRIDDREDPAHAQRGMALLGNGQHMSHDEIAQRLNDGSAKLENHLARPIGVEELESRRDAGPATHAHISFVHTDGLNDKASIERRGKSVLVKHGQNTYKVSAHDFDQNKSAIRGSYVIKPWTMDSERRKKNESNDHW